jgi:phage terminase large subunit
VEDLDLTYEQFECFDKLDNPRRVTVFFGGRGSGKSWNIAQALIAKAIEKRIRVLCARELQKSIKDSVHKLLADTIERMGAGPFFEVLKTSITGANGSEFIFTGVANNVSEVKSMEGVDICWLEEAHALTQESLDILLPTFRKKGSTIWISFNPFDEMDAVYQNYVAPYLDAIENNGFYESETLYVRKVNYDDNPKFWETELVQEMEECKQTNWNKYQHIWLGYPGTDYEDSIIKPEWVHAALDAHKKLGIQAEGLKVVGFDPADEGSDAVGLVYRHGVVVTEAIQRDDTDITGAINWAFNYADDRNATHLVYDGIGLGAAVKDRLMHMNPAGRTTFESFVGSQVPHQPERKYKNDRLNKDVFKNLRAQSWWLLRDRFHATYNAVVNGHYSDPDDLICLDSNAKHVKQLMSELVRVQRKRDNSERIQLESKQDMRKRNIPSPNLADALAMAFMVRKTMVKGDQYSDWNVAIN